MNSEIEPRKEFMKPRPERMATVTLSGCEFFVGWDGEAPDYERHHFFGITGRQHPTAWVECVKLDGKWWEAHEVFSSDFCDQLDAALLELEEFGLCKA
jgi:hypothetical protein